MNDLNERIRRRAHQIWIEEGRPEGRDAIHWDMARELIAIEDNQKSATMPVRRESGDPEIAADEAEPAEAANTGELPTLTDEGEQVYPPSRAAEESLDQPVAPEGNNTPKPRRAGGNSSSRK